MSASNIQTVQKTATGAAVNGRTRLFGLYFTNTGTAATITLRDGGAAGAVRLTLATPAAAGASDLIITDNGSRFEGSMHLTVSSADLAVVMFLFAGCAAR